MNGVFIFIFGGIFFEFGRLGFDGILDEGEFCLWFRFTQGVRGFVGDFSGDFEIIRREDRYSVLVDMLVRGGRINYFEFSLCIVISR